MSVTFAELVDSVAAYYGTGSDQWVQIARYGISSPDAIEILKQVPGVNLTLSNSGKILGWDYNNSFGVSLPPASTIDSNVQNGIYGAGSFTSNIPSSAIAPSTELPNGGMNSGARLTSTGSVLATVADRASLAVAGVALGTKLGKLIDSGIYALNPDWFDEHFPTINPETWDDIATTQGGKQLIRSIFGLQNDEATMYFDERLLAQAYMVLLANGAYNTGGYDTDQSRVNPSYLYYPQSTYHVECGKYLDTMNQPGSVRAQYWGDDCLLVAWAGTNPLGSATIYGISDEPNKTLRSQVNTGTIRTTTLNRTYAINGKTFYYATAPNSVGNVESSTLYSFHRSYTNGTDEFRDALTIALLGSVEMSGLDGVNDNPEASEHIDPNTLINPTTGQAVTPNDSLDDVLQALRTQYPDLFNNSIYTDVPQNDGTTERYVYIPVPYPNTVNPEQPISDTTPNIDPQTQPQVDPATRPDSAQDIATQLATPTTTTPDTGDGNTPPAVIPTGSTSALYSIYNPTQAELNSFGAWLWSSNFVDQLLKLFSDPMQAIIGLHKVFAQPAISGTSTIKVGYLDSGVSSNVVGNQYTTIDCGSVNVSEYFGNVFDYAPFTQIYIYLPFVGIEKLDTGDVMRGVVGVKYHVDVLTGACLAEITITRDGAGGILYTFAGNCAVQYPISSGSYIGIVASLASITGGVVGTVASGGALAPVAMGAVSGIMNAHARVNHSGAFSGNAGAMGVKKPYLIITRPQTCLADNFHLFDGYPANKTTTLSACSGFVKCETCHIENVPATDEELVEIEMLLKGGIII